MAFFTILSLVPLLVGLAAHGLISPQATVASLIGLVLLMAIGQAMGTGLAATILRVGIPVLSIMALALYYGAGSPQSAVNIAAHVCEIGLVLFAIYIMVSGPFRR